MRDVDQRGPLCRFGSFELDVCSGELRKHGVKIKLQEQPRQILALLLEQPGEVVTRTSIQKHLWPDGTFVDFDNAINSAVRKLRDALNDTAENPRFVETLSRRGYRFVAPASRSSPEVSEPEASLSPSAPRASASKWKWVAAVAAILLLAGATPTLIRTRGTHATRNVRVTPLTANPGLELQPSFSSDGTRIAYVWNGPDAKNFAIYTKLIGAGDPVRITTDLARDFSPAWSPDGRWVAALRDLGRESAIILIPASGGQHRELARVNKAEPGVDICISTAWPHICGLNYWGSLLAWSPDGKYLFTSGIAGPDSPRAIIRISASTGEQYAITSPPPGIAGDFGGRPSPDGQSLAFARVIGAKTADLYVVSLSGATSDDRLPRRITSDGADVEALTWTADGRELVFSSDRAGRRELWRVEVFDSAKPQRVAGMGENSTDLAISPDGKRLAYSRGAYTGSLWKIPIEASKAGQPMRVTATTARDKFSHFSPDGKRIAFQSARSGVDEIWMCDADGGNAVQLTNFGRGLSGSPRWSPDGETIAFDSNISGNWDIYVIRVTGGGASRLTTSPLNDAVPSWSRDSRWIYFSSSRSGHSELWKIRPDGSSETLVTKDPGYGAVESIDGKSLYYKRGEVSGEVWIMPVGGGPATKVLSSVSGRLFTVTRNGIYFAAEDPLAKLRYYDFKTRSTRSISTLGNFAHADVSSDERWALYPSAGNLGANLMLVEDFR